jgi:DNA anti-recombination protein RmuC
MGNYLTAQGVARQENVQATYLSKEDAQRLYATNANFRAEVDRLIAEDARLNTQHTDFVSGTFNPLSAQVGNLRTDLTGLQTTVTENNTAFNTWKNQQYNPLSTQVGTLETNLGTLQTNFNGLDSAYYGFVENQYNPLSTQVGTLGTNLNNLRDTVGANNAAFVTWRNEEYNPVATQVGTLQGQYTTLNNNFSNHQSEYNKFSAGVRRDLGNEILRVENKFDTALGRYATLEQVENLNGAVQSGLSASEVATIKSVLGSTEFGDAISSLGIQRQQTTTTPPSYLRTRNYMLY